MLKHLLVLLLLFAPCNFAQRRVDLRNTYQRLLCVVPIIGSGTAADPRRPEFAPLPQRGRAPSRNGILAFSFQPSDDGKYALVEFVARDRSALRDILNSKRPDVKVFEKGKVKREDVEKEFRKYRKDFDLNKFGVGLP